MSKRVCYTVFIEDKPYLLWQVELFLYSITVRGGIDPKDIILFWTSPNYFDGNPIHEPWIPSPWLEGIIKSYPTMHHRYCQNFGRQNRAFRFLGNGKWHQKAYAGLNKWSSFVEWANADCFKDWDEVWVLEQDLWFSDKFPELPEGNLVSYNWIPDKKKAFHRKHNDENTDEFQTARGFKKNEYKGLDLEQVLKLTGASKARIEKWAQGAVLYKLRVKDLKPKLLNDIMNYNYMLIHMMEIEHPLGMRHETDMIAPGLALANSNIEVQSINDERLLTETWTKDKELPKGTIVHYGWDFNNYKHLEADFGKHRYGETAPWQGGMATLRESAKKAKYEWTRNFFTDMMNIHYAYPNVLRECLKRETPRTL